MAIGSNTIIGGEGGEDSDTIDLTALTVLIKGAYTSSEPETVSDGINRAVAISSTTALIQSPTSTPATAAL
ncbi:hypothetical protein [Sulfitobacter guttiformis]|uniref:hypothetical protein n=1 Tax=Sulfitobacter guttiformis TaxID=74349 RepID=UPI0004693221|nr:hypothetical protein [Sulfitobacter guttiformis]KIN72406.1 hypothetical protein Z949_1579 [Sulfitobacter guttiformis KCTC 32187]